MRVNIEATLTDPDQGGPMPVKVAAYAAGMNAMVGKAIFSLNRRDAELLRDIITQALALTAVQP